MKKSAVILSVFLFAIFALFSGPAFAVQDVASNTADSADGRTNGANFSADFTLTVADGNNINSTPNANGVTTATTNTGSLAFAGYSTVQGVIGTSSSVQLGRLNAGFTDKTVTFSGASNMFVTSTVIAQTGTLVVTGNLTGSTLNYNDDGNVTFGTAASAKTLSPTITTSTTNKGSLNLIGDATVSGQVGTSAAKLKVITGGYSGAQDIFSSDVFATNTIIENNGTMTFNGNVTGTNVNFNAGTNGGLIQVAGGKSIAATITTGTTDKGSVTYLGASTISLAVGSAGGNKLSNVNVNGGIVTIDSAGAAYGVTTTTVNSGGTLKIGGTTAQTITGAVTLAGTGTVDVGANTLTVTGVYTQAAGQTLKTTISNATTLGNIVATTVAPSVTDGTIDIHVAGYVPNNTSYKLIDAGAGGITAPTTIVDDSAALSFTDNVTALDLFIVATRNYSGLTSDPNASAVGTSMLSIAGAASGDMANVIANLDSFTTAGQVDAALQQLDPEVNGGVNQASFNTSQGVLSTVGTRLDNARGGVTNGGGQMGVSMGDEAMNAAAWLQGFGASASQDTRSGVNGYDANTWGVSGGADWEMSSRVRMGLGFAFAQNNVDTKGGSSNVDADSYTGSLYGSYDSGNQWYADGMFAFGWNNYSGGRKIQFTGVDRVAQSDYDGQQYTGKIDFGYNIPEGDWTLVPMAGLMYAHLDLDKYTETGASDLNLTVNSQSYDFLQSTLGAKLETSFKDGWYDHKWVPEFHALWLYEYLQDEAAATATFAPGGPSFKTTGLKPEQSSGVLGVGVTLWQTEDLSFNVRYDYMFRSDYSSHTGSACVRYEF